MTKATKATKPQDPEMSRRKFINAALGVTAGVGTVSLLTTVGGLQPISFITEGQKPLEVGDVLVFADGPKAGQPVSPDDIKEDGAFVSVYPKGNDVIRNEGPAGTHNAIILLKYPEGSYEAPVKAEATAQGIIAHSKICTHLGCPVLSKNEQGNLPCPCHGSAFSAKTGEVLASPAPRGLPQLPIKIENGQIVVADKWIEPPYGMTEA